MKLEFVGQPSFSFRIPSAPLYTPPPPIIPPKYGIPVIVRVQTQGRILFEGVVPKSRLDYVLAWLTRMPRNVFNLDPMQYVSVGIGPRVDWSGYLTQTDIGLIISCLKGGACPGIPATPTQPFIRAVNDRRRRAQVRSGGGASTTLFGTPNTLGQTGASVSVGGGLLGLAVLALAGYGVYKLVT
jgi:hypothetical protein